MAKFSQLFYTVLPAFPCHLPIFLALMIAINQLFSSNSTSSTEAKARRQFERERAIDHELRRSRHGCRGTGYGRDERYKSTERGDS
jgi:hypothetical protein